MTCATAKFTAAFQGATRLTPTPAELQELDRVVSGAAQEAGADEYTIALHFLWHAQRAATSGFSRLAPIEEVREAKERPTALGVEVEPHLEGA